MKLFRLRRRRAKDSAAKPRTRASILVWFLTCWIATLVGCTTDISEAGRNPTGYIVGDYYQLGRPLIAHMQGDIAVLYDPVRLPKRKGVLVAKDSVIRVDKVLLEKRGLGNEIIWVRGRLEDGPLNRRVVELVYVSEPKDLTNQIPAPDLTVMRRIEKPGE